VKRILVDTGAIYAFVRQPDANHLPARAFVRDCIDRRVVLVLSDAVFSETMNLLNKRQGPRVAIEVGVALRHTPLYQWQALGPDDERATWALFQKYDDKAWSYTDCAVLALAQRLRIAEVFTFDADFDQMPGIVRLPR